MTGITLRVDGPGGTTKTTVSAQTAEKVEELKGEMDHGEVVLHRDAWADVDGILERRTDRLIVEAPTSADPFFAGRFDDDKRGDGTVTVSIAGYERDSKDAEPTNDNVVYQNVNDSAIVTDLISQIPTLEVGSIETLASNLSVSFSYANPSKALRDVAEATGAELRYNYDQTVDYIDRRGSDRSAVELSPGSQTLTGDLKITEDAREQVTHVQGFGAQSGPDQVTSTAVAASYNGGRAVWREYENKDIKEKSRLQRIIDQQVDEYDGEPRHLEVETGTTATNINIGDRVTVKIPDENVNRMLRVLRRRSILGTAGATLSLLLSNRLATRDDNSQKARKDLQRFNRGYEGFVDRSQITSGWNAAGDGTPQELVVVNWPDDIVEEQDVTLAVQGRAWRSPIDPQPHDHEVTITIDGHVHDVTFDTSEHDHPVDVFTTSEDNAEFTDIVAGGTSYDYTTVDGNWATVDQFSPSTTDDISFMVVNCAVVHEDSTQDDALPFDLRLYDSTAGTYYPGSSGFTAAAVPYRLDGGPSNVNFLVSTEVSGHSFEVQMKNVGFTIDAGVQSQYMAAGAHNHTLDFNTNTDQDGGESIFETTKSGGGTVETETTDTTAGASPSVITTFEGEQYYPSDVAIEVNGTQVGTIAGDSSSSWTETIDLEGELSSGLNTITATPSTRGELNLSLASELFRRGRTG